MRTITLVLLTTALAWGATEAQVGDDEQRPFLIAEWDVLLEAGDILEVIAEVQPGRVVSLELDHVAERWIYLARVVARDGTRWNLELDARDGAVLWHGVD